MNADFTNALATFVRLTQDKINAHYAQHYENLNPPTLVVEMGRVNAKVISEDRHRQTGVVVSRSVFCFVRIADGAILKAAGWKAPAKHARGSIYVNNGQDAVSVYGANYLR